MLKLESTAEPFPADAASPAAITPERAKMRGAVGRQDRLLCALAFGGIAVLTLAWSAFLVVGAFQLIFG